MMDRATGFYWIDGSDGPEPAHWDADAQTWSLIGLIDAQEEEDVTVLSDVPIVRTA